MQVNRSIQRVGLILALLWNAVVVFPAELFGQRYSRIIEIGPCIDSNTVYRTVHDRRSAIRSLGKHIQEIYLAFDILQGSRGETVLGKMKSSLDSIAPEVRHFESFMCDLPYAEYIDQYYDFLDSTGLMYGALLFTMTEDERRLYGSILKTREEDRYPPCIFPEFPEYSPLQGRDSIPWAEPIRNLPSKRIEDHPLFKKDD
jgi:hypothetical protein